MDRKRSGVTLIELLVVIAIIAVLAGLVVTAVMMALRKNTPLKNRSDMQQLSQAIDKFYSEKRIYPASKIRLRANQSDYVATDPIDQDSLAYLNKLWPSLGNFKNIAWAGPTAIPGGPAGGFLLEGDQCLVFFLGGFPNPNADGSAILSVQGLPVDPNNPGGNRSKYYEFDVKRLYFRGGSPFPSYNDQYGIANSRTQPFMYFSSGNRPNGYNTTTTSLGVSPYLQQSVPTLIFYNPDKYQIISAGNDGVFGPGGTIGAALVAWTPTSANLISGGGADDMTNFYDSLMGVSQ